MRQQALIDQMLHISLLKRIIACLTQLEIHQLILKYNLQHQWLDLLTLVNQQNMCLK